MISICWQEVVNVPCDVTKLERLQASLGNIWGIFQDRFNKENTSEVTIAIVFGTGCRVIGIDIHTGIAIKLVNEVTDCWRENIHN